MRSPKIILENLQKHSKEENYKYERLYRNLYNEDFYLQALQNIYANKGALSEIFNYPRRILKSADMKGFQRYFLG